MAKTHPRPHEQPGTGAEDVPPGATRKAWDRPTNVAGNESGSGAGTRHMSGDIGDGNELSEEVDRHRDDDPSRTEVPSVSDDRLTDKEGATAYAGLGGGAVGGTPAEGRSSGGNIHRGIAPEGVHRGDSTIGSNPPAESAKSRKRIKKK
jgi:hypothetical protein